GANPNAYFEVFNEPNMYTATDLISLYTSWLAQFPAVPKNRIILDGTGNAQNVPNIGSASALASCLLAVHDYSFFGSDTWTTESQWVSQFKGEVGSYADRTVCTEWGGPMSPGSKNGVSYGSLDYSKSPTNYFEAYIRGMSSQLHAWGMGSFYWVGLKDSDWYSMTTRSGTGSSLVLSVPNQSGLTQLQNAWTAAPTSTGGAGAPGTVATGAAAAAAAGVGGPGPAARAARWAVPEEARGPVTTAATRAAGPVEVPVPYPPAELGRRARVEQSSAAGAGPAGPRHLRVGRPLRRVEARERPERAPLPAIHPATAPVGALARSGSRADTNSSRSC